MGEGSKVEKVEMDKLAYTHLEVMLTWIEADFTLLENSKKELIQRVSEHSKLPQCHALRSFVDLEAQFSVKQSNAVPGGAAIAGHGRPTGHLQTNSIYGFISPNYVKIMLVWINIICVISSKLCDYFCTYVLHIPDWWDISWTTATVFDFFLLVKIWNICNTFFISKYTNTVSVNRHLYEADGPQKATWAAARTALSVLASIC